jgi:hypothetical protein
MIYDGQGWFISENNMTQNRLEIGSSRWSRIEASDRLETALGDVTVPVPSLPFGRDHSIEPDLAHVQGIGLWYAPRSGSIGFRLDQVRLVEKIEAIDIYTQHPQEAEVSRLLFGLCVTPSGRTTSDGFLDHFDTWVEYLRWPGGSMIEDYDIQHKGSAVNYSIGQFIQKVRARIPRMQFLIGVSTKLVKTGSIDAKSYVKGLIHYTQDAHNTPWGDNPALSAPAPFGYLEIGNEPGLVPEVAPKDTSDIIKAYAQGAHEADPKIQVIGPSTIHGNINTYLKSVLKSAGDSLDIVDIHNYTDNPHDYLRDIRIVKDHIRRYLHDTPRRKKSQVGISFSEYNSLPPDKRKGTLFNESWGKIIWQAKAMSFFMLEGVRMASLWHANMGGEHAVYSRWGDEAYPIHYGVKFWHDRIGLDHHPHLLKSYSIHNRLLVVPIQSDDKIVLFVTSRSSQSDEEAVIDLLEYRTDIKQATVERLTRTLTGEYYAPKKIAQSKIDAAKVKSNNPLAHVEVRDGKVWITLPNYEFHIDKQQVPIEHNQLKLRFPAYSVTAITLPR